MKKGLFIRVLVVAALLSSISLAELKTSAAAANSVTAEAAGSVTVESVTSTPTMEKRKGKAGGKQAEFLTIVLSPVMMSP